MDTARHLSPFVFLVLLLSAFGYIAWRGEKAERACIFVIAVGSIVSALAADPHGLWQHGETGIFLTDLAVLAAFIAIMGASKRFWPLWITAFQIIAVMTHVARFLKPSTVPLAYAVAEQLWALPMQVILLVVVWRRSRLTAMRHTTNGGSSNSLS